MLHIRLLGNFQLVYDGEPVSFNIARLQALLAYLVLHRDAPQPRRYLAFHFWPDSTEAQARTNLRRLLHDLRQALPDADEFLLVDGQTLQWRPDAPFSLDVALFQEAVRQAGSPQALQEAVDLYRGELLPNCYDDWILPEREQLHQKYVEALENLVTLLEQQADYRFAIRYAQCLLQADPLHEEAYRRLMHLHALNGDRTGVVRTFNTCQAVLEQELGVEPAVETRKVYEQSLQIQPGPGRVRSHPPAPTSTSRTHNLPAQLTSFIGREQEKEQLKQTLQTHRLVTLTGPGGSGKTRLALAVAAGVLDAFADAVWWVDLAPLSDGALVVDTVASTLGIFEGSGQPLLQILVDYVRDRQSLLILDNCEHVTEAAGYLAETLLQAGPKLRVLATSRVVLNLMGELVWSVPPLPSPDLRDWQEPLRWLSPDRRTTELAPVLMQYESVQLFLDRAVTVLPSFTLTRTNAPAVGRICQRLDGIPLAIELAAARVKVLAVQQIAERLDNALQLLGQGSARALPRQQTLRTMMDWSYGLLSAQEQTLFRWLAVFAGSFNLEAVEAICQCEGVAAGQALDLLAGLVDKSLVAVEQSTEEARFRLHEIARQYAHEKLTETDELECVQHHHLRFFLNLAETAEPHVFGSPEQVAWLNRLEREHDNLRAALERSGQRAATLPSGCADAALRLAGELWMFWFIRGYFHEGRRWVERALAAGYHQETPKRVWGKALYTAASFAYFQGDYEQARALSEQSLAACREAGDQFGIAISLHHLGIVAADQGEFAQANALLTEGLNLARISNDAWIISLLLHEMGVLATVQGQLERAEAFHTEDLAVARQANDKFGILYALGSLAGNIIDRGGDYQQAKLLAEESLSVSQEIREKRGIAFAVRCLGLIARHEGRYEAARELLQESLALLWEVGDRASIAYSLLELAILAERQGDALRAAHLLAATEALHHLIGLVFDAPDQILYDSLLATLLTKLEDAAFEAAWARGLAMSTEQAVRYALEVPDQP